MSWAGGLNSPPPQKIFWGKSEGKEIERKRKWMFRGGGIVIFLRGEELARWFELPSPSPPKKINYFVKSEGEEIERKRRKMKMGDGGGGGRGACVIILCNCNFLTGGELARW